MKKLLTSFFVILFVLLLTSCAQSQGGDTSSVPEPVSLSDFENKIYSILVEDISTFNNPSSVKLIAYNTNFFEERILLLRISGTNKLGATVTNDYVMVIENFKVTDAYDYLDYYESGHMPAMTPEMQIEAGTVYSFETWGDPYQYEERDDVPDEYFVLYQIANYAIPETNKTNINIANINKALDEYKTDMGW